LTITRRAHAKSAVQGNLSLPTKANSLLFVLLACPQKGISESMSVMSEVAITTIFVLPVGVGDIFCPCIATQLSTWPMVQGFRSVPQSI
jgi:hypothetical protein